MAHSLAENRAPAPLARSPEEKSLLRFLTCGSVDDGKSTLIGRLLHDTKRLFEDQLSALERDSRRYGTTGGEIDFVLKCVAPDLKTFQSFVEKLTSAPNVRNVKTSLTLRQSKDAAMVPME